MKRYLLFLAVMLLSLGVSYAHTSGMVEKTCPLCREVFTCELDMSGTQVGMRLDLKPLGPIAAPWRVPVCPKCHFVIFDDEIPAEALTKCKEIVQGNAYKSNTGRASYYLLGLLYEGLKKDPIDIGHVFLKASWQEESDGKNLEDDLKRSLQHFEVFLKEPQKPKEASQKADDEDNSYETAQLLKGEILRRLGRFDDAKNYLSGLQKLKPFQGTFLADIVRFETSLCDKKDSKPHYVSEVERAKNSEPTHAGDGK